MHTLRSILLGVALAGAAIAAVPAMASAASSCTCDPSTRTATVTVDDSGAPGFTSEADGHPEIEIVVRKVGGVSSSGETTIIGTPGSDVIRIARGSVSLHSNLQAGKDLDDDIDLVLPPGAINVLGGQGADFVSGQGYGGRLPTLSPLDLRGGPGDDTLFGGTQGDHLFGVADNDTLRSADQSADLVIGGPQFDNAIHDSRDRLFEVESSAQSSVASAG